MARCSPARQEAPRKMDIAYAVLTVALFALTWGLLRLCERV